MEEGTPMGLDCLYLCTWATCGAGSCGLDRRDLRSPPIDAHTEENTTTSLRKRVFHQDHLLWTVQDLDRYMTSNLGYSRIGGDQQFVDPNDYHMLIAEQGPEQTVAKQRLMSDVEGKAFQIGTNLVHGCTVAGIVSNKAVWMAPFRQTTAIGIKDHGLFE